MGSCLSTVDDAVNDFLDQQSRYYKESTDAKKYATAAAAKKSENHDTDSSHLSAVLKSDLSPIYPSLPKAAKKYHCNCVYDGDTLTLDDGSRVRLIGIDTPELKEKQPFAVEAKEYTKKYCHGRDIWLTFDQKDATNSTDHYGRLLAFVWVNLTEKPKGSNSAQWLCINEGLVAAGLANAYSPSNTKKIHNYDKMLGLQKLARTHKCGQWKCYKDEQVITTPSGSAFHKCKEAGKMSSDCKHLSRSKNLKLISASEAYDKGLHPCRNCMS
jgi:endonuclease YncB( thermonuclease family)